MPEKHLKELEFDLMQYEQAYAFGDIDKDEYEPNKARITRAIEARKLVIKKQEAGRVVDRLFKNQEITRQAHAIVLDNIRRAKSEDEIQCLEFRSVAA